MAKPKKPSAKGSGAASPGPTFFELAVGPTLLAQLGPLIVVQWRVPDALEAALVGAGRPVPPPVGGVLLLDTGASSTCISMAAAAALGLSPTRIGSMYGAGGRNDAPIFFGRLEISITDGGGRRSTMAWQLELMGVPELEKSVPPITMAGRPVQLIGLLGRDLLRHAYVKYNGVEGKLRVEFAPHTFQQRLEGS